mgnify:CR=1 FL=1
MPIMFVFQVKIAQLCPLLAPVPPNHQIQLKVPIGKLLIAMAMVSQMVKKL